MRAVSGCARLPADVCLTSCLRGFACVAQTGRVAAHFGVSVRALACAALACLASDAAGTMSLARARTVLTDMASRRDQVANARFLLAKRAYVRDLKNAQVSGAAAAAKPPVREQFAVPASKYEGRLRASLERLWRLVRRAVDICEQHANADEQVMLRRAFLGVVDAVDTQ
jgi:hypothetical protein